MIVTAVKAAITLGIPVGISAWFWWRYPGLMWVTTIPFGFLIALLIAVGNSEEADDGRL